MRGWGGGGACLQGSRVGALPPGCQRIANHAASWAGQYSLSEPSRTQEFGQPGAPSLHVTPFGQPPGLNYRLAALS